MDLTSHVATPHSPVPPPREHRDDVPALPPFPRPGRASRVTQAALTHARATLNTAERQIIRTRGTRKWRLTMRIDSAHATIRAGGLA